MAAATTRAITPTHSGPFAPGGLPTSSSSAAVATTNSLTPLAATVLRASPSRSQASATMSPRASPQPPIAAKESDDASKQGNGLPPPTGITTAAINAAKAAEKLAQPLAAAVKDAVVPGNGVLSKTSPSPSVGSINLTTAPTTTAPAVESAAPNSAEPPHAPTDSNASRAVVDPGITGETGDARAFTYPPPLQDALHTPARNMSLPNAGMSASPKTGSGAKRHKCPYCETEFTRHHNLKSHLLTHSQEKPYECTQCNSRFRRLHDLKRHTKLHTGERPHECAQCGRKFARGDALARHTKGPGGCAGRRASFGGGDDDGTNQNSETMDGVEYTAEPEHMDEDEYNKHHGNEPAAKRMRHESYRQSTYPGPAVPPMYPPPRSRDASISSQGPLSSVQHFNASAPVFPHGVTESPKPISPGQGGEHRGSLSRPPIANRGTSPLALPPPTTSGTTPHGLPSMASFPPHPPQVNSHGGSLSSHNSGSGASSRDIFSQANAPDVWAVVRELEVRLNHTEQKYKGEIAALVAEIAELKKGKATEEVPAGNS